MYTPVLFITVKFETCLTTTLNSQKQDAYFYKYEFFSVSLALKRPHNAYVNLKKRAIYVNFKKLHGFSQRVRL